MSFSSSSLPSAVTSFSPNPQTWLGMEPNKDIVIGSSFSVLPIPIFSDNYCYLLIDIETKTAAAVDPAEPRTVLREAMERGVRITSILCTHHHWDHAGGNEELVRILGDDLEVVGSAYEEIPCVNVHLKDGDSHKIQGTNLSVRALYTPCHTRGHILYHIEVSSESKSRPGPTGALFSGDTLFIGGCGRFFEGDANDMIAAMKKIKQLPDETLVFCGHEYTKGNVDFIMSIDSDNPDAVRMSAWTQSQLAAGSFTIPSTIGNEKLYNPFMRTADKNLQQKLGTSSDEEAMAKLRIMKNEFKST